MTSHEHVWTQTVETKPYPGQPQWEYVRTVSRCVCGRESVSGWHRRLRSKGSK